MDITSDVSDQRLDAVVIFLISYESEDRDVHQAFVEIAAKVMEEMDLNTALLVFVIGIPTDAHDHLVDGGLRW